MPLNLLTVYHFRKSIKLLTSNCFLDKVFCHVLALFDAVSDQAVTVALSTTVGNGIFIHFITASYS